MTTPVIVHGAESRQDRRRSLKTQSTTRASSRRTAAGNIVDKYQDWSRSAFSGDRGPRLKAAETHAAGAATEAGEPPRLTPQTT